MFPNQHSYNILRLKIFTMVTKIQADLHTCNLPAYRSQAHEHMNFIMWKIIMQILFKIGTA